MKTKNLTLEELAKVSPEEMHLRFTRAKLVLLIKEMREAEKAYTQKTGNVPPKFNFNF